MNRLFSFGSVWLIICTFLYWQLLGLDCWIYIKILIQLLFFLCPALLTVYFYIILTLDSVLINFISSAWEGVRNRGDGKHIIQHPKMSAGFLSERNVRWTNVLYLSRHSFHPQIYISEISNGFNGQWWLDIAVYMYMY